jgi:hypothetical protein
LLATFCDNILKKGCSEKLSDEAIEDALEKVHICLFWSHYEFMNGNFTFLTDFQVVRLLAYISDKDLFAEFYRLVLSVAVVLLGIYNTIGYNAYKELIYLFPFSNLLYFCFCVN